ncbi:aspartate-semialdehyde dehydrogenase [Tumebacillus algifaecis]|uniref:Aspartate-semialdehyde dehydrogenase n=1 Tax=Tumebacillus algifaecis TaxID=1214604 RepID=A0A223D6K7_9BACL|nr:aspartate-semialdehyde dehydrogenase [Tumebacillus algifaecis]ASS77205.1 aspartate-semialdehyde dehydrogenase [Tumebacillus algifaecis]
MVIKERYNVAVVGATGAVGQKMIETLEKRDFPVGELRLLASPRSVGQQVMFKGQTYKVEEARPEAFEGIDFALFAAGGSISEKLAPEAVERGAVVIDNTSVFRMVPEVPLVVPEVNPHAISQHQGIIANPNCSTIQMVVALKPLYDAYGIERIIVSTYQAVSGAGQKGVDDLLDQTRAVLNGEEVVGTHLPVGSQPKKHQMAFNAIPQIDVFEENGFSKEEMKMVNETRKIFGDQEIQVTPTAVRIPVLFGHAEAVYIETEKSFDLEEVRQLLEQAPGITVLDNLKEQEYPMPAMAEGTHDVYVGRIRRDLFHPRGLNLWVVSDNVLKGAAWNAVQIAEYMVKSK